MAFTIKIPCSSANIGPGFDVIGETYSVLSWILAILYRLLFADAISKEIESLIRIPTGLALSIYLELEVTTTASSSSKKPKLNCSITYEGEGAEEVSLDPEVNLITRVALYVLRCHNNHAFPTPTHVHIKNPIPLGRGLGSSGAAVTAGVMLGNEVGQLGLDKARMLDYCLMIGMQLNGSPFRAECDARIRPPSSLAKLVGCANLLFQLQNDIQIMLQQRFTVAS